jgi:GntR family transcriptional repressor for pyruvate dehydrogenase complex
MKKQTISGMTLKKTPFQRIEQARDSSTTEQVVAQIHAMITRGELRAGDRLPAEREMAKQLGISRPSLRSGLRSLVAMGVLRSRHGSGTYIAEGPPALESEALRLLAALHGFTYDEMFEARRVLEASVAGLAAERATGDQLATLAEELANMYATIDNPHQYLIHDIRFHRAVGAACGNPILAALVEMVSTVMYDRRRETVERARDFKQSVEMHQRVYRAIRAHKPEEARAAMHEHIELARQAYQSEEREGHQPTGPSRIKPPAIGAGKLTPKDGQPPSPALAKAKRKSAAQR